VEKQLLRPGERASRVEASHRRGFILLRCVHVLPSCFQIAAALRSNEERDESQELELALCVGGWFILQLFASLWCSCTYVLLEVPYPSVVPPLALRISRRGPRTSVRHCIHMSACRIVHTATAQMVVSRLTPGEIPR
ncbi:unnamed protein product, partial [Ectocarpus sp. 13 AM-2016]